MNLDLPHNWKPRRYQMGLWNYLIKGGKRAAACWHRRAGKDAVLLHHNACAVFERVGNYWYLLPEYNQCRKAIWDAINPHTGKKRLDEVFPKNLRKKTLNQEMKIEFQNGSTWQLMGSDNFDALVGSTPYGLTFSEYALSNPSAWGFLSPILLENGGWAVFNSTPRGKNHFYKMMQMAQNDPNWYGEVLTAEQTGVFNNEQLLAELKRLQGEHGEAYGKAIWLQEYYCSFEAALPGSIWGESIAALAQRGGVCEVSHTEGYPVFTAWDLGRTDDTAVWFYQVISNEIRVIDYYEDNFREIPELAQMLRDKQAKYGYEYGTHWVPHDAVPIKLGMGGKSLLQQFIEEDVGHFAQVPHLSVENGIQAARATFKLTFFDREKCEKGLEHLKNYRREFDEKLNIFSKNPVHDGASHASDAWRYLSLTWKQSRAQAPELTQAQKFHMGNVTAVSFGALKKAHLKKKKRERLYGRS